MSRRLTGAAAICAVVGVGLYFLLAANKRGDSAAVQPLAPVVRSRAMLNPTPASAIPPGPAPDPVNPGPAYAAHVVQAASRPESKLPPGDSGHPSPPVAASGPPASP